MSQDLNIVATLSVKPGKLDDVLALFKTITQKTRELEPGVLIYYQYVVPEKNEVIAVEKYANKEAFHSHMKTAHLAEFMEKLPDLLEKPAEARVGGHPSGDRGLLRL